MRFLHTSDWHVGRRFHQVDLLTHQRAHLAHLARLVTERDVDVVVVAGDVYDRALPAADAVAVLDDGVDEILAAGAQVLMSAGNHDSAVRLGFGRRRSELAGLHIRTDLSDIARPVVWTADGHTTCLYALPYLDPPLVHEALGADRDHASVLRAALTLVRADAAERGADAVVVAAHAFVAGGVRSASERDIAVGGIDTVGVDVFAGFDYVALGHIHGPATLTDEIRYCGSPLAYSFSEAGHTKGTWLVDVQEAGRTVEWIDAPVPRPLARLRGTCEEVLADPALAEFKDSWCEVTLTDARRPTDAMARLRRRFAHTVVLRHEPPEREDQAMTYAARVAGADDALLCERFVTHVRGEGFTAAERDAVRDGLTAIREGADR